MYSIAWPASRQAADSRMSRQTASEAASAWPGRKSPEAKRAAFRAERLAQRLKEHGATIDHLTDHGMTKSVYFFDPDGNKIEFFCNSTDTAEEGLALMRAPGRENTELLFDDVPVS